MVFFLETVEHLPDTKLLPTLGEIRRILKTDGVLICSTRNEENLLKNKVLCPDCGCVFHRMQHVRSFSAEILTKSMEGCGFKTIYCNGVFLFDFLDGLYFSMKRLMRKCRDLLLGDPAGPNLIYIGRKS